MSVCMYVILCLLKTEEGGVRETERERQRGGDNVRGGERGGEREREQDTCN